MPDLPSLGAHAHIDPQRASDELIDVGVVLAMTISLGEAEKMLGRNERMIAWGVGCHPRKLAAQKEFTPDRFESLVNRSAIIGEIGLDVAYQVPLELQPRTFRTALTYTARNPLIVSIHAFGTNSATNARSMQLVLDELGRTPVKAPILHWRTGTAAETRQAVDLGCYFSVHSAVAHRSTFRTQVPRERLLVESDHGWADPPGAIPHRVIWVEYLLSASLGMDVKEVRQLVWRNFSEVVRRTGTQVLLPQGIVDLLG
jgi:TatD DNase family protein